MGEGLLSRSVLSGMRLGAYRSEPGQFSSRQGLLDELCVLVSYVTGAHTVLIASRGRVASRGRIIGKAGSLATEIDMSFVTVLTAKASGPVFIVPEIRKDPRFRNHQLFRVMPHMKSLMVFILPHDADQSVLVMCVINPRRTVASDGETMRVLTEVCQIVSEVIELEAAVETARVQGSLEPAGLQVEDQICTPLPRLNNAGSGPNFNSHTAARFLMETLIHRRQLHVVSGSNCISLRTWRKPVEKYQELALNELLDDPLDCLVTSVAGEMLDHIRVNHLEQVIRYVAAAPSSACTAASRLNVAIARRLAATLRAEFVAQIEGEGTEAAGPLLMVVMRCPGDKVWQQLLAHSRHRFATIHGLAWIG